MRTEGRRIQRKWQKPKNQTTLLHHQKFQRYYKLAIKKSKKDFVQSQIKGAGGQIKALFRITQALTAHPQKIEAQLPPPNEFCQSVADYFVSKVATLRDTIDALSTHPDLASIDPLLVEVALKSNSQNELEQREELVEDDPLCLTGFRRVTEQEVEQAIIKLGPASSVLDPLPMNAIKVVIQDLLPDITRIINSSITTGVVPKAWKEGIITPLPKKEGIDMTVLKNLRPVSQLRLLPRITEALLAKQIQDHLEEKGLLHDHQSGFRKERGTETATLDIREKMLWCADSGHPSLLILLDLSAAFDTVDHSLLIQRIAQVGRIGGTALRWLESFLEDRCQRVKWQDQLSQPAPVMWGVPQGSSLSPILFNIYMRPLADALDASGLRFQMFADDTQILVDLHESSKDNEKLAPCLMLLREWMRRNKLCLNPDKTELLLAASDKEEAIGNIKWPPSWGPMPVPVMQARNLGVEFSHTLGAEQHAVKIVKSGHHQLNSLSRVFPFLELRQKKILYQAMVGSRIRYGLSHLLGAPKKVIYTVQKVQNRAIRMICGLERRSHLSSSRQDLGWLTIENMIKERVCLLLWKSKTGKGPRYGGTWTQTARPQRKRRQPYSHLLAVPSYKRERKGGRTMAVAGGKMWNNLPPALRQIATEPTFRLTLRKHLFEVQAQALCRAKEPDQQTKRKGCPEPGMSKQSRSPPYGWGKGVRGHLSGSESKRAVGEDVREVIGILAEGRNGLSSPPLPTRSNTAHVQHAAWAKKANTDWNGVYAPRRVT